MAETLIQTPPKVNVIRTGSRAGTPVVLVHPAGLELSYWDRQIEALSEDYGIVAFDLPGHGRSAGSPEDWTRAAATRFITETITAIGTERVHLVGLSLGGILAQSSALAEPSLVQSMTLIDTAAAFSDQGRSAMRARAQTAREHGMSAVVPSLIDHWFTPVTVAQRPDLVDRVTKTLVADDPLVHAAMWEMIASFDVFDELPRISCPTLVLVGELDSSSPVSAAQALRDQIPDARLRVIPNSAHMTPLEKPETINRHLREFLATAY